MTPRQVGQFFARLAAVNPAPATELTYVDPYTLLVAVILSAQTTDVGVNKATTELFKVADTPQKMVALGEDGLRQYIKTIGLFNNKAKAIIAMSRALLEAHGGKVPGDREALEKLPGVGRKTANVVLNSAFGEPTIAVDTHVFRVANRTGLAPGRTPTRSRRARGEGPRRYAQPRPSLADPARPLRLRRAQAQMPRLRGRGPLRIPGQDPVGQRPGCVPVTACECPAGARSRFQVVGAAAGIADRRLEGARLVPAASRLGPTAGSRRSARRHLVGADLEVGRDRPDAPAVGGRGAALGSGDLEARQAPRAAGGPTSRCRRGSGASAG